MAKKVDEEKGEEYVFTPPDFDEDAFIHRELTGFRTTAILVLWGIVAALVAWLVYAAVGGGDRGWAVSLAVAIVAGLSLKFLFPMLRADVSHYGRKEWLGTAFLFFFTWLAVFIIVLNPPVSDHSDPHVEVYLSPPDQQHLGDVAIDVFAVDNDRIEEFRFMLLQGNRTWATTDDLQDLGDGHYRLQAEALSGGTYSVQVQAIDNEGATTTVERPLSVSRETVRYEAPGGNALADTDDHVRFDLPDDLPPCDWSKSRQRFTPQPCIRHAYLALESGGQVQLTFDAANGHWVANKNHDGWSKGSQTFTFHAHTADRFHGQSRVAGGEILAGPFTIDVTADLLGGRELEPPVPNPANPPVRQVPGIGLVALAAGLLAAAYVVRRR